MFLHGAFVASLTFLVWRGDFDLLPLFLLPYYIEMQCYYLALISPSRLGLAVLCCVAVFCVALVGLLWFWCLAFLW
jgi:hypothetical protein